MQNKTSVFEKKVVTRFDKKNSDMAEKNTDEEKNLLLRTLKKNTYLWGLKEDPITEDSKENPFNEKPEKDPYYCET